MRRIDMLAEGGQTILVKGLTYEIVVLEETEDADEEGERVEEEEEVAEAEVLEPELVVSVEIESEVEVEIGVEELAVGLVDVEATCGGGG